jgi:hypothetical protein
MKNFNWKFLSLTCICAVFMVIGATDTFAYPDFNTGSGTSCVNCHSEFSGGPGASLHDKHQVDVLSGGCNSNLCHGDSGSKPVSLISGTGCAGCHGRSEDAGNDFGSDGLGAGLRQWHENEGKATCGGCHGDNVAGGSYTPVGEHVLPPFYTAEGLDPCDDNLDNNGDGVKDVCDTNMIYGTISGLSGDAVTVDLYIVNCGISEPVGSPVTNAAGYYEEGGLVDGQYSLVVEETGYSFVPASVWAYTPNSTGLSYDFTATAVD